MQSKWQAVALVALSTQCNSASDSTPHLGPAGCSFSWKVQMGKVEAGNWAVLDSGILSLLSPALSFRERR